MQINAFTRNVYSGHKLKIKTFMPVPSVYFGNSSVGTVSAYPILFISYEPPRAYGANKDFKAKDAQFKVNPKNFKKVLKFFQTIYSWFTSDDYRDLFIIDEESNKMIINMDYRDLKAILHGSRYDAQTMLAIPTVIEEDALISEGCALAINQRQFACGLPASDIEDIVGILENFNFQAEASLLLNIGLRTELVSNQQPSFGGYAGRNKHKVEW